jgi:hypothetical protein
MPSLFTAKAMATAKLELLHKGILYTGTASASGSDTSDNEDDVYSIAELNCLRVLNEEINRIRKILKII